MSEDHTDSIKTQRTRPPWHGWYKLARWLRIRDKQLADEPLCRMCLAEGRVTPATVCDHVEPHRGDPIKFWAGPFQSLCGSHHSRDKQGEEQASLQQRGVWD